MGQAAAGDTEVLERRLGRLRGAVVARRQVPCRRYAFGHLLVAAAHEHGVMCGWTGSRAAPRTVAIG